MRKAGEEKNDYKLLEENFNDIFEKYNEDIFNDKKLEKEKDPFFNLIKNNENKESNENKDTEIEKEKDKTLNADDIFYNY